MVIRGMLRRTYPEENRREEEVCGRVGEGGARAPAEADPGRRGSCTEAKPRPRPPEGGRRRARGRGTGARGSGDRRDAGDLLGHRGSGARAVLAPGARRRARTLHARSGVRAVAGRARRGEADRARLLRGSRGAGTLEHAAARGQGGGARHRRGGLAQDAQKNELRPHLVKGWVIPPKKSARFVWRMEEVLDLYEEPRDPLCPVVCFDERPCQLLAEVHEPLPVAPGSPERRDHEYERRGTAHVLMAFEPLTGWRRASVTERRRNREFAEAVRRLAEEDYPDAEKIRLVCDNLSTHTAAAFYETFEPERARRLARRVEFCYTPVHGSWLNMVEIELSVLVRQCLKRRLPDIETLQREVEAWAAERNRLGASVDWRFTAEDARTKLRELYPSIEP